ncbi:MAG: hypothetical protein IJQ97_04635 [Paludibacteraceae bacterium]|nr:hypothetical protein [Paludibacteraceae bacterium]
MATKSINTLTNIVLPAVVLLATVGLFVLLRPEQTTALYWINMSYLLILEAIFFGWLLWARSDTKGTTSMLIVMLGNYAGYYLAAGLLCIIVSAVVSQFTTVSIEWYVAALIVITILWCIPAALTAQVDSNHAERQAQVPDKRAELLRQSEERKRQQLENNK